MAVTGIKKHLMEAEIIAVQKIARNEVECAHLLGVNYKTYKKYANLYGIFGECKKLNASKPKPKRRQIRPYKRNPFKLTYPIDLILQNKFKNVPKNTVKNKLIDSGIKKCECELCGYKDIRLMDNRAPLILHFIDKDENNYALNNLQLACFNCSFIHFNMWAIDPIKTGGWGKYQLGKKAARIAAEREKVLELGESNDEQNNETGI